MTCATATQIMWNTLSIQIIQMVLYIGTIAAILSLRKP